MLPDSYRWLDSAEASYLRHGYRWVAIVRPRRGWVMAARCNPIGP